jgi:hypothetical protein
VLLLTTPTCAPLAARVGPTSDHTTATSSNSAPYVLCFLDIVISTKGIRKLKIYSDGTIHYANLAESGEPNSLVAALNAPN